MNRATFLQLTPSRPVTLAASAGRSVMPRFGLYATVLEGPPGAKFTEYFEAAERIDNARAIVLASNRSPCSNRLQYKTKLDRCSLARRHRPANRNNSRQCRGQQPVLRRKHRAAHSSTDQKLYLSGWRRCSSRARVRNGSSFKAERGLQRLPTSIISRWTSGSSGVRASSAAK